MNISMFTSKIVRISMLLAVFAALFVSAAPAYAAYDPFSRVNCGKAGDSTVCNRTGQDPVTGPNGVIRKVTQVIATIAGAAAVIIIVLSGIRYITSGGDAEGVSRAKKTIIFAAVGLIVIVMAQALINFVLNRI